MRARRREREAVAGAHLPKRKGEVVRTLEPEGKRLRGKRLRPLNINILFNRAVLPGCKIEEAAQERYEWVRLLIGLETLTFRMRSFAEKIRNTRQQLQKHAGNEAGLSRSSLIRLSFCEALKSQLTADHKNLLKKHAASGSEIAPLFSLTRIESAMGEGASTENAKQQYDKFRGTLEVSFSFVFLFWCEAMDNNLASGLAIIRKIAARLAHSSTCFLLWPQVKRRGLRSLKSSQA